jgi:riboflavin biosynthesis pyrimidine reductase
MVTPKDCALAHPPARHGARLQGTHAGGTRASWQGGATTVVTTEQSALGEAGQAVVLAADAEGRIDIHAWVQYLGEQAFNEIMVEAGPTLSGCAAERRLGRPSHYLSGTQIAGRRGPAPWRQ